jgi:3',5'-cyclic AMP phosphodiesterase CpdA
MLKFIQLSDLHFHSNDSDNSEAEKTLHYITEKYPEHYIIITGDITDDGHEKQYEIVSNALLPFKGRVFLCPGNHDFGAAGNFYSHERAKKFDKYLSVPLDQGGTFYGDKTPVVNVVSSQNEKVMLIALDANLETEQPFDFACGEIGETQLRSLRTILFSRATLEMKKILFLHHHPFIHNNPFMELIDAKELWRTVYGHVDVMAFGHKHVYQKWENYGGIQWVLASDNSPGKKYAHEIVVKGQNITAKKLQIS